MNSSALLVLLGLFSGVSATAAFFLWRQLRSKTTDAALTVDSELDPLLEPLLHPLRQRLDQFEKLIRETYDREGRERFHLEKEIKSLMSTTQTLSHSLRGDSKAQGDWGEVLLEKILESSGLRAGQEFELQRSLAFDGGDVDSVVVRPDAVVYLPQRHCLVIDAKVSLTAWDRYCRSEDEEVRTAALDQHVLSLRRHIATLSQKSYHVSTGLSSPEFVFLFTRVESAWIEAVRVSPELLEEGWRKNVIVVSPTTLYAALRTVAGLWGRERQNKNALAIADEAGKMFDKFSLFCDELANVERESEKALHAIQGARRRLSTGPGNLISRAEKIQALGARTSKGLSSTPTTDQDQSSQV